MQKRKNNYIFKNSKKILNKRTQSIAKKPLVIGIIILLVGASFTSAVSGLIKDNNEANDLDIKSNQNKRQSTKGKGDRSLWTTTEIVSDTSSSDCWWPSMVVEDGGGVHVAWDEAGYIYYRNKTSDLWGSLQMVRNAARDSLWPSLVYENGNTHVAWSEYGSDGKADIWYALKERGYESWNAEKVFESSESALRPSLAVDADGFVHIAWLDSTRWLGGVDTGTDKDIFYRWKHPDLPSWSGASPTELISSESNGDSVEPSLAVRKNDTGTYIHIVWEDYSGVSGGGSEICHKTIRFGEDWSTANTIQISGIQCTGVSRKPSITIDDNDYLHIVWYDNSDYASAGTDYDIFYQRRTPGGAYTLPKLVSTESYNYSEQPSLATYTNESTGTTTVHVSWSESSSIAYKNSTSPTGWGSHSTEKVSTESSAISSWWPSIGVDGSNTPHIAWADRTNYGGSGTDIDIFYKKKPSGLNLPPTADPNGPYTAEVDEIITFDGSNSYDEDGTISYYRWDFDYDGVNYDWDTSWLAQPTTTHSYSTKGEYKVALQVEDNDGARHIQTTDASIGIHPDLTITTVSAPTKIVEEQTYTFSAVYRNIGDDTAGGFYVRFKIDGDSVGDPIYVKSGLRPTWEDICYFQWTPPVGYHGISDFTVTIEYDGAETDKNNNDKTVSFRILPANYLRPELNFGFLKDICDYALDVKNYVKENWRYAFELWDPTISSDEKKKMQKELVNDFPRFDVDIEEKINIFCEFLDDIINDNKIITFTPDGDGTLVDIQGGDSYYADVKFYLLIFEITKVVLDASLMQTVLTFYQGEEIFFKIYIEPLVDLSGIGIKTTFEFKDIPHSIPTVGDVDLNLTNIISIGPPNPGLFVSPIVLGFGAEMEITVWADDDKEECHIITLTFNEPFSLRNAAVSAGLFISEDMSAHDIVGGGAGLSGGIYASVVPSDFSFIEIDPLEIAKDIGENLSDCYDSIFPGGFESGMDLNEMLESSLDIASLVYSLIPDSAVVGITFGIEGKGGVGIGAKKSNTGAEASVDAKGSYSVTLTIPVNLFGDVIDYLQNGGKKDITDFFLAVQKCAAYLSEIIDVIAEAFGKSGTKSRGWVPDLPDFPDLPDPPTWEDAKRFLDDIGVYDLIELGIETFNDFKDFILENIVGLAVDVIKAFWDAYQIAGRIAENILDTILAQIVLSADQGIGLTADATAGLGIEGAIMLNFGPETTLKTLVDLFTLEFGKLWSEGYAGVYLSTSSSLAIDIPYASLVFGSSKNILKCSVQGDDDCGKRKAESKIRLLEENYTNVTVISDYGVDTNGDSLYDNLIVDLKVNVSTEDKYAIGGLLRNNTNIGFAGNITYLTPGEHDVSIHFNGLDIRNQQIDGPYELGIIVGGENSTTTEYKNFSIYTTSAYDYTDFQNSSLSLTGVTHEGFHTNTNGLYDYLKANVNVYSSEQGEVYVYGVLDKETHFEKETLILVNDSFFDVGAGSNQLSLYFDGKEIRKSGLNTPYNLTIIIYNVNGIILNSTYLTVTGYAYDEFEPPAACLLNYYFDYAVDTDGDLLNDYLAIDVAVNVTEPGIYSVDANLNGTDEVFHLSNSEYLAHDDYITLTVDGVNIRNTSKNQRYSLIDLVLYQDSTIYGERANPYNTSVVYNYNDFEYPLASLNEVYSEHVADEDGDLKNDYLKIDVGVIIKEDGRYMISGYLNCSGDLVYAHNYTHLSEGTHSIGLIFDGEMIREQGNDGYYDLERLGVIQDGHFIDFIEDAYTTLTYYYANSFDLLNKLPIADFFYSPSSPKIDQTINFNASDSSDPDGLISSYKWYFGDGTNATTGPLISHSYSNEGYYTVSLVVNDNRGDFDIFTKGVNVRGPIIPGHWHFDEGTDYTAYDSSKFGNDGTIHGTEWVDGISNKALDFDGIDDYVDILDSLSLDITNKFSVEAWIKVNGSENYHAIVDKYHGSATIPKGYTLYLDQGRLRLSIYSSYSGNESAIGTSDLRDKTWHHVAGLWNGTNISVYVDGVKEGDVAWAHYPDSNDNKTGIGKRLGGYGGEMYFNGTIDEVRIANENIVYEVPPPDVVWVGYNYSDIIPGWQYWRFNKIQDGIDMVDGKGTVYVENGTYYEMCTISHKSLDLVGNWTSNTTIDARSGNRVVFIEHSDWVNISGFELINASNGVKISYSNHINITDNWIEEITYKCVDIYYSNNNTLSENLFFFNDAYYGIHLTKSRDNDITYNTVNPTNVYGIRLTDESTFNYIYKNNANGSISGVSLTEDSTNNTIIDNTIVGSEYGFHILSDGNYLTYNKAYKNTYGICLIGSNHNYLAHNTAQNNTYCGIYLGSTCTYNTLYQNYGITAPYGSQDYGIYLFDSHLNTLSENHASADEQHGIYLKDSYVNTLSENMANSHQGSGICLDSSSYNIISHGQAFGNQGISLVEDSCYNNITGVWVTSNPVNGLYGIYIGSNSNHNDIGYIGTGGNWIYNNKYGIYITSSSYNKIYANDIGGDNYRNEYGICLDSCNNNNITFNDIDTNINGINIIGSSSQNDIYDNDFYDNSGYAIIIDSAFNTNPISKNIFFSDNEHGILIDSSSSQMIDDNLFFLCGISIQGDSISDWNTHIITDNTVSGHPIRYYKNQNYVVADTNNAWQIILGNCDHMTVENLTVIDDADIAIQLGFSSYNNISNNTIVSNDCGIYFEQSSYNTICNDNGIFGNDYGIWFKQSTQNNITGSSIEGNEDAQIYLEDFSNENNISCNEILVTPYGPGVFLNNSILNTVYKNNITAAEIRFGTGIFIINCLDPNFILDNYIFQNFRGIICEYSDSQIISDNFIHENHGGIFLLLSDFNEIAPGNYVNSTEYGIWLDRSSYNIIDSNIVESVPYLGIWLEKECWFNGIFRNIIRNNSCGVKIESWVFPSWENSIYHNDFINNAVQASDDGNNYWNDDYLAGSGIISGGNYWDDYNGWDNYHGPDQNIQGSDGIGNQQTGNKLPYPIPGGTLSDEYPYLNPGDWEILPSLYEAVDNIDLMWTTGGHASWFGQEQYYYYDNDAAQTGAIAENLENTWIKTFVNGPGTLKFYWNVSSKNNTDWLKFFVDITEKDKISGNGTWQQESYNISSGYHDLVWQFTRGAQPALHLEEDFDDEWPPTGWTEVIYGVGGNWEQMEVGVDPAKEPSGATGYYAIADSEMFPSESFEVGLRSPPMDLSTATEPVYLECGVSFDGEYGFTNARIIVFADEYPQEYWDIPLGQMPFLQELNYGYYTSTSDVQIELYFNHLSFFGYEGFFSVDNVVVYEEDLGSKDRSVLNCGWLDKVEWTEDNPPYTPSNPDPIDGATNVNISTDLNWTGGDPDPGDTVTYNVYFGTSNPPTVMVSNNQTDTTYDPGTLDYNTIYYWRIIAWDNHNLSAIGPIWSFTTEEEPFIPVFYPTDDSHVDQYLPDTPVGSNAFLLVRTVSSLEISTLIKFDLNSIPPGTTINSATVNLYHWHWWDVNPAGRSLDLHHVTSDWDEDTVTYNTRPSWDPGSISSAIVPAVPQHPDLSGEWMGWDVTAEVQNIVNGIIPNYGWQIMDHGGGNPMIYFRSKENATDHPYLMIDFSGVNNPPYTPSTPDGPTPVYAESGWNYLTSTTDPEGHQLFYKWDWGDEISGWIGPFDSGIMVSESHTWTTPGDYNVKVKAKDDPDGDGDPSDGLESEWSESILITVKKPGDINGDDIVDVSDLLELLAAWGECPGAGIEPWIETFDSYLLGSGMHGQGGWAGWDNDPTFDAYISDNQSHSVPHSIDIKDLSDIVHEYSGVDSGQWTYTAHMYIPEEMYDTQYFILLNTYPAGLYSDWSLQIELDGLNEIVKDFDGTNSLPMIKGQWVEIRVEIDLEQDEQYVYYNNTLLVNKSWSEGVAPGGAINIAAVDLYANNSLSSIYYDGMSLKAIPCPADINNDGIVDVQDLLILLANWD